MTRILLVICFVFISMFSFSQQEQEILTKALCSYKMELPKLEKQALKELKKLDKDQSNNKNFGFVNYQFIIIPMFKLKEDYIHYQNGDTFAKYIDFEKMHNDFEVFVFKDTIYKGSLHLSDYDNSYFSVCDTNKYNISAFKGHSNLVSQILKFKPDMVFYPDCPQFPCFIKEGKLYIGSGPKQLQTLDSILSFDEFVNKTPSFIKELQSYKNPGLKHYKVLKICVE
jgi:hypothetical protein